MLRMGVSEQLLRGLAIRLDHGLYGTSLGVVLDGTCVTTKVRLEVIKSNVNKIKYMYVVNFVPEFTFFDSYSSCNLISQWLFRWLHQEFVVLQRRLKEDASLFDQNSYLT